MPNYKLIFQVEYEKAGFERRLLSFLRKITISATDEALARLIGEAMVGEVIACEVVLQEAEYFGRLREIEECSPISGLSLKIGREQEAWANVIKKLAAGGAVVEPVLSDKRIIGLERA
jgi:hypothetical protein